MQYAKDQRYDNMCGQTEIDSLDVYVMDTGVCRVSLVHV